MVYSSNLEREFEVLGKEEYVPQEYVSFWRDLFRYQSDCKKELSTYDFSLGLSEEEVSRTLEKGKHLLDFTQVTIERKPFEHLLLRICGALEKYGQWEHDDTERIQRAFDEDRCDVRELLRKAEEEDTDYLESHSQQLHIERVHLHFLATQTGKPLFELFAEKAKNMVEHVVWKERTCPVCGREPAMAKFEKEEGRRMLWCSVCGTEWTFRRLQCPFCLNDDHETLRFFFADEGSPYRVDVCDQCKRYLKTVDERKVNEGKEVVLALENIATIFLDLLATGEGFLNPHQHFFGMEEEPLSSPT